MAKINKYLDANGLTELINLIQAGLNKKQDWMQFTEMPAVDKYIGKVVQYTGVTDSSYTKGYFYYSNGIKWSVISTSSGSGMFVVVSEVPDWDTADTKTLYLVRDDNNKLVGYVKNELEEGVFYKLGSTESSGSIKLVNTAPEYASAEEGVLYMVYSTDGMMTGYMKNVTDGVMNVIYGTTGISTSDIDDLWTEIFG